jgi:hypothetical protein
MAPTASDDYRRWLSEIAAGQTSRSPTLVSRVLA